MEADLYRSIASLEEEKQRLASQHDKISLERRQLEEALRISEDNYAVMEKQYQLELNDTYANLVKLK